MQRCKRLAKKLPFCGLKLLNHSITSNFMTVKIWAKMNVRKTYKYSAWRHTNSYVHQVYTLRILGFLFSSFDTSSFPILS